MTSEAEKGPLFHVAPTSERERIRQHGLQPSNPKHSPFYNFGPGDFPPLGVYGFNDLERAKLRGEWMEGKEGHGPYDIWEIPERVWNPPHHTMMPKRDPDLGYGSWVLPNMRVKDMQLIEGPEDRGTFPHEDTGEHNYWSNPEIVEIMKERHPEWEMGKPTAHVATVPPEKPTVDPTLLDPNKQFSEEEGQIGKPNAFLDFRDEKGEDPLQGQKVIDNASLINTEWHLLPNKKQMEEAIENAFRAVLLSPRKDLRWNTIHYQDLMDVRSTDPTDLWRHLEQHRQDWNVKNLGEDARYIHRPYGKLLPEMRDIIIRSYKRKVPRAQAEKKFERILFEWETQEQDQVMREEAQAQVPEGKRRLMYQVENEANKRLAKRIEQFIRERQTSLDEAEGPQVHEGATGVEEANKALKRQREEEGVPHEEPAYETERMVEVEPQAKEIEKKDRYGAFMGSHLKAIAKISFFVEDILEASLLDIHKHEGSGHHFRSVCLQLKIPGVGPKVCSFAWLLLAPLKSQLATIDTHMMDVLGKKYEGEMNNRDYFKFERELKARRDAAGYNWIPLGAFQWGMWDYKRTGPGSHQDHSGLQVLNPKDYDAVNWEKKEKDLKGDEAWDEPYWWEITRPAGDEVGNAYAENISPTVAQNKIPYEKVSAWRFSVNEPVPWFIHPYSGERLEGLPGETLMQHIRNTTHLSTPEIWQLISEAGKS